MSSAPIWIASTVVMAAVIVLKIRGERRNRKKLLLDLLLFLYKEPATVPQLVRYFSPYYKIPTLKSVFITLEKDRLIMAEGEECSKRPLWQSDPHTMIAITADGSCHARRGLLSYLNSRPHFFRLAPIVYEMGFRNCCVENPICSALNDLVEIGLIEEIENVPEGLFPSKDKAVPLWTITEKGKRDLREYKY
jgi:hypothetical protein